MKKRMLIISALSLLLCACSTVHESTDTAQISSSTDPVSRNILAAYFSLAGEQYNVGVIEEGNTSIIAHMIQEETDADLFAIEPVNPYPENMDELLDIAKEEQAEQTEVQIASSIENMEQYDIVFIGYPIWYGDMPRIIYSFLESYDFTCQTVIPFCTHGGSGLADTETEIREITGAQMLKGLAIAGTTAQNDRNTAEDAVEAWLQECLKQ